MMKPDGSGLIKIADTIGSRHHWDQYRERNLRGPRGALGAGMTERRSCVNGSIRRQQGGTGPVNANSFTSAGIALAYKLIDAAQARCRAANGPHLVAGGSCYVTRSNKLVRLPLQEILGE